MNKLLPLGLQYAPITSGNVALTLDASPFRLLITRHAPRLRIEPHDHADPSINIVLAGGCEERIGRRTVRNVPGTVVVKPAGAQHANRYCGRSTISFLIQAPLWVLPTFGSLARAFGEVRERQRDIAVDFARRLAKRMAEPAAPLEASEMIWQLLRRLAGEDREPPATSRAWVIRVRDELLSCARGSVHFASLASAAGVDPATLSNSFKKAYGCTPSEFVRRQRVEWARSALRQGRSPISTIALEAGFADQAHFTRAFKRETGLTPGQFRRFAIARS